IVHSEFNASETERVHSIQIWIEPSGEDLTPSYQQIAFAPEEKRGKFRLIAGPDRSVAGSSTVINQDARIYVAELGAAESIKYAIAPDRFAWIQVLRGSVSMNDQQLREGDGASASGEKELSFSTHASGGAEFLLFDLA